MTTAQTSLLQRILDDPADDQARLVYADALLADGDPRGELITVEHQLAQRPTVQLADRRRQLLRDHARTWWPELMPRQLRTRLGFVEGVAASEAGVIGAKSLFEREPITELEVTDDTRKLLARDRPWLSRIRTWTSAGSIKALEKPLGGTPWPAVEDFTLVDGFLRGIVLVPELFPRCRRLALPGAWLGESLDVVGNVLPQLDHLDLGACRLEAEHLDDLLGLPSDRLRTLRLSRNPLEDAGAQRLAALLPAWSLARLELVGCGFTAAGRAALAGLVAGGCEIVIAPDPAPTIDLVGLGTLRFVVVERDRWGIEIEGKRRRIHWKRTERIDQRETIVEDWQQAPHAPIGDVVRAVASGVRRELTLEGIRLGLSSSIGAVYNTSVYSSTTASLKIPDDGPVEIVIDEYTSID